MILGNTYHLENRPGSGLMKELGKGGAGLTTVESAWFRLLNSLKVHPFQAIGFKLTQPAPLQLGGLHEFMNWNRGMLTDSGGFQMVGLRNRLSLVDKG